MPNRIIRAEILTSPRVNSMSDGAVLFFHCLLLVIDDFARFHASPELLLSACFPHRKGKTAADIVIWLEECAASVDTEGEPLIQLYTVKGVPYLFVLNFRQQVRNNTSKYPEPPKLDKKRCVASAQQLRSKCLASAQHLRTSVGDVDVGAVGDEDEQSNTHSLLKRELAKARAATPKGVGRYTKRGKTAGSDTKALEGDLKTLGIKPSSAFMLKISLWIAKGISPGLFISLAHSIFNQDREQLLARRPPSRNRTAVFVSEVRKQLGVPP